MLLMGIGGNIEMWDHLRDTLPDRQLIAFDAPGTGLSSTPLLPMPMLSYARLTSQLIDHLGHSRVDLLGVSWGGVLAQQMAISHGPRIRRMVLAATLPGLGSIPGRPQALRVLATPRRYYSRSYLEKVAPILYGGRLARDRTFVSAHAEARMAYPPSLAGYFNQMFALCSFSSVPFMHRISCPTLILAGDDDPIVPVANAHVLHRGIRGSTLRIVPGGGHLFIFDDDGDVGREIGAFLDMP